MKQCFRLALLVLLAVLAVASAYQNPMQDGAAALDKGDLATAQAKLEEATRLAPGNARAWLLLANTYGRQKKASAALEAATKAEKLGGSDAGILVGLVNFYTELEPDAPKAASLGARYAELRPEDKAAWRRVAALYVVLRDTEHAIAAGQRAVAADDSPESHSILAKAYALRRDWPHVEAELKRQLELDAYDEKTYFLLSQAYLMQEDFPSAITVLQNGIKVFDKSPQLQLSLGVAYYGARNFPGAVDQFLKVMDLAPDLPQPYAFLGRILEHAGNRQAEVMRRFAEFQANNPNNPLGYVLHAKAIIAQLPPAGYPPEATAAEGMLRKALSLHEEDAEAHLLLGTLLERKENYTEAATHLERSIALNPKNAAAHYRLARVYLRLGRKEAAEEQRAIHEKLTEEEGSIVGRGAPEKPKK
jgi:tetratricopeptide (TPR) repeat protein